MINIMKKFLIQLAVLLGLWTLSATSVFAAITFDTANNAIAVNTTSLTMSHTVSGTNPLLIVGAFVNPGHTVTGVTYNGIPMTELSHTTLPSNWPGNPSSTFYYFFLLGPATGTHNVVISANSAAYIYGASASYTGIHQSNPIDSSTSNSGTSITSLTTTNTTVANSTLLVGLTLADDGTTAYSAGANTTYRANSTYGGYLGIFDSNGSVAPGAHALTAQRTETKNMATIQASFAADTVLASNPPTATNALQDLRYTYDALGNITQIVDAASSTAVATTTYSYDGLSRLTLAAQTQVGNNWVQSYTYDPLGNLTNKSDVGNYVYAQTGYTNPDAATSIGATNYTYDTAGNMLLDGAKQLAYNWRNRLTNWWSGGSATTSLAYTYDTQDQRVSQSVKVGSSATSTTNYWNRYYETSGATSTAYVFAGDQLVATVEGNGSGTTTTLTHTDHLNGTNVTSSATGTVVQRLAYTPYGAIQTNVQSTTRDTKRKYIGQYYDSANSLSYLNARYYDGVRGQFLAQDPIARDVASMGKMSPYLIGMGQGGGMIDQYAILSNPQLLNSYAYAGNNPINLSDPSGLWIKEFATGQQSWSSFQLELGDATQQMTQSSPAWNFAVSHPYVSGAGVGALSTVTAWSGALGIATAPSIVAPGVGTTYVLGRVVSTTYYLNSAQSNLGMIGTALNGAGSVPSGSSLLTTAKAAGNAVVAQKVNAVRSVVNGSINVAVNVYQSAISQIQGQINSLKNQVAILQQKMSSSKK